MTYIRAAHIWEESVVTSICAREARVWCSAIIRAASELQDEESYAVGGQL